MGKSHAIHMMISDISNMNSNVRINSSNCTFFPFIVCPILKCFFGQDLPIFRLIMYGETPVEQVNCGHQNYIFMLM